MRASRPRTSRFAAVITLVTALAGCAGAGRRGPESLLLTPEELASMPTLRIGDPAPPLAVSEWVRGEPVAGFERGRVYVLDWWAVWCGACLASMGRTSALQEAHGDSVAVIAMTAVDGDNPLGRVRSTAARRAATMRMRVAVDDGGRTTDAYLKATRQTSIPRAFVVDGEGRLAWIGHPADAEPVVESVLAGKWDLQAAAAAQARAADETRRSRPLVAQLFAAQDKNDVPGQMAALEHLAKMDPSNIALSPKFTCAALWIELLSQSGRMREATLAADEAMGYKTLAEDPWAVAMFASAVRPADAAKSDQLADRSAAMLAERRRLETTPPKDEWEQFLRGDWPAWDAEAYDWLSSVRAKQGRTAEAIELLEQSIRFSDPGSGPFYTRRKERLAGLKRASGTADGDAARSNP